MKKRIVLLCLCICTFTVCVFTQGTFAWFTDAAYFQKNYQIGDIQYLYTGSVVSPVEDKIVVPGEPLIDGTTMFLTNKSTIDTNFRVQIRYQYEDQTTHYTVKGSYSGASDPINQFLRIGLEPAWQFTAGDSCWHYQYNTSTPDATFVIPANTATDGFTLPLISNIQFVGEKVDNALSGTIFKIELVFQAKQANFVNWNTFDSLLITGS